MDRWGKRPSDRTLGELMRCCVINLDKPRGPTSHQATAWVKAALNVPKIGHGGTLDPNVSGVLPLCVGKAAKLTDLVLSSDKEYVCAMTFHGDVAEGDVADVMARFTGKIYQMPPVRSSVRRQLRIRTVHGLELLELSGRDALFRVHCDAGTYVRTLCTDMGEALGVGAHMSQLRRTKSGTMREGDAVTLQDLADAYVFWQEKGRGDWLRSIAHPVEALVEPLPKIVVKATAVDAVCRGADLGVRGIHMMDPGIRRNALAAAMTARGELIAVGKMLMSSDKAMASDHGIAFRTERVMMDPGHYPSMWKYSTDLGDMRVPRD